MNDLYADPDAGTFTLPNPPAHHTADPETSREALDAHESTGRRERHKAIVLELVRRHPLRTAIELWEAAGPDERVALGDFYEVRRRLSDLLRTGKVHQRSSRPCLIKKTKMMTWEAVSV